MRSVPTRVVGGVATTTSPESRAIDAAIATAQAAAAPLRYRPDVDGLRALAVLAVLAYHAFPTVFRGGFVGVDVFFVISGFLISGIIEGNLARGRFTYADFYARRIRRIFPALALVLAACLAIGWFVLYAEEFRRLGKHVASGAAFVSNIFFWRESDYFDPDATTKPLLHLWSLGVEEQFYVVWPLVLAWTWRSGRNPRLVIGALGLVSFILCLVVSQRDATAAFYAPYTRLWELATGAWLAVRLDERDASRPRFASIVSPDLRSTAGAVLLLLGFAIIDDGSTFPGWLALLPVAGTALLIAAGPTGWLNRVVLSRRIVVAIGLVSFPLYLWHWPLLSYLQIVVGDVPSVTARLVALAASFALAVATWHWVERPIRTRGRTTSALVLAVAIAVVGGFGAIVYASYGLVERAVNAPFVDAGLEDYYQSRQSDASCPELLGARLVPEEVCLANSAQPKTLFVGDSHAMALYSAIHVGRAHDPAVLVAGHSCSPYPNLTYRPTYRTSWANNCTAIAQQALEVAARHPSIETIVVVSKPPAFESPAPSRYSIRIDGPALDERTAFLDGTGALIDALQRQGKRVVFSLAVPEFPSAPTGCERRVAFVAARDCSMTTTGVERSRATYVALVSTLKERHPGLVVFDPLRLVCSERTCSAKRAGRYLYHDEQHMSIEGSVLMLDALRAAHAIE